MNYNWYMNRNNWKFPLSQKNRSGKYKNKKGPLYFREPFIKLGD